MWKRHLLADSADVPSDELVADCHLLLLKQTVKRLGRSSSGLDFDGDYATVLLNEKVNLAHGRVLLIVAWGVTSRYELLNYGVFVDAALGEPFDGVVDNGSLDLETNHGRQDAYVRNVHLEAVVCEIDAERHVGSCGVEALYCKGGLSQPVDGIAELASRTAACYCGILELFVLAGELRGKGKIAGANLRLLSPGRISCDVVQVGVLDSDLDVIGPRKAVLGYELVHDLWHSAYGYVFPEKEKELVVDRGIDGRQGVKRLAQHTDDVLVVAERPKIFLEVHGMHDDLVLVADRNRLLSPVFVESVIEEGKSKKRSGRDDIRPSIYGEALERRPCPWATLDFVEKDHRVAGNKMEARITG